MEEAAVENNDDLEAELAEERQKLQKVMAQMKDHRRMERAHIVRETQAQRDKGKPVASTMQPLKDSKLENNLPLDQQGSEFKKTPMKLAIQEELHAGNVLADTSTATVSMDETKAMRKMYQRQMDSFGR